MRDGLHEPGRMRRSTAAGRIAAAGALALCAAITLSGCATGHDDTPRGAAKPADTASDTPADTTPKGQATGRVAVVYRTPTCGCCKDYETYLREHGYTVESVVADDLVPIRARHGVPEGAASCHTAVVDGYAVEGHVPVEAIEELLDERPDVRAIALPGMPLNSPGMGDPGGPPLEVVAIDDAGRLSPFMTL